MSSDDQAFLDVLSSVPHDIKRYSSNVADYVDKQLNHVSNAIRELAASLPDPVRSKPPPPPPKPLLVPASTLSSIQSWVLRNKLLTTVLVIAAGGASYYVIKGSTSRRKKRRAKRAGTGARLEVVVLAGSPSEPMTRSIALDLERRGFIVYIVCNTIEEEVLVQNESRPDIKPLMIDIVDTQRAKQAIERFTAYLQHPHTPLPGTRPHHLTFRSLLLIPSNTYPSAPIAALSPSTLSDLLNTRLLTPILTLQTFLPLLQSLPLSHPHHTSTSTSTSTSASSLAATKPSVLVLTPNIIPSLNPAFHLPESSITAALTSFTQTLTAELSPLNIPVTHLQLGTFDFSSFAPHAHAHSRHASPMAQTLSWDEAARAAYARDFATVSLGLGRSGKGSSLRVLNDAVFDAMVGGKGGVRRVGMGSSLYGFVGNWVPRGLVGWMTSFRGRGVGVRESGGGIVRKVIEEKGKGLEESEYVSVYGEDGEYLGGDKGVDEVLDE